MSEELSALDAKLEAAVNALSALILDETYASRPRELAKMSRFRIWLENQTLHKPYKPYNL